jgi:TolB-like protein
MQPGENAASAPVAARLIRKASYRLNASFRMHPRVEPGHDCPTDDVIRSELDRVLASEPFSRSERLSGFLRFVVEETLSGRGDSLKEAVLASTLYGKAPDFDGATNPVVRVDARRVRDKLREHYSSAPGGAVVISLPKGSYVPAFDVSGEAKPSAYDKPADKPAATVRRPVTAWPRIALAFGVVALAAVAYAILPTRVPRSEPTAGRMMVAVLPLQNLTGDPGQEYLCDGLTEEMIALLGSASSGLDVIARTSAMHYKNTTKKADEIARELGVGYLLETSLRRVGDRVRITAQLVDASTQGHVWIEQYERDLGDVMAMQRDLAGAIAKRTVASLGLRPTGLAARANLGVTSSLAYEHYLRGRYQWAKDTKDGLFKALDHFHQAIALEPSYARAYSGLAETYA